MLLFGRMILSEKSATFRRIRSANEHRDELTIDGAWASCGSAAATGRRMRGERNAAHAKSAITDYFITLAFGGAHKICRSTGWKNREPICCPPTGTSAKGDQRYSRNELRFQISRRRFRGLCRRGAQPDPLWPDKEWVLLPMVNFNIRPLGGIENKEVKNQFLLLGRQTPFSRTDETVSASKFATPLCGGFLQKQS